MGDLSSFLSMLSRQEEPTWGFDIYATYALPLPQHQSQSQELPSPNSSTADTLPHDHSTVDPSSQDNLHFHSLVATFQAHAADTIREMHPLPQNQQLIDSLHLRPISHMSGASLANICQHFKTHHIVPLDKDSMAWRDQYHKEDTTSYHEHGKKHDFCLVITDDAFASMREGTHSLSPDFPRETLPNQGKEFVVLLHREFDTMTRQVLSASGRAGNGEGTVWEGWMRVSPCAFFGLYEDSDWLTFFEGVNVVYDTV
ncbi:hypothetical protein NX059_007669 [Plenodomus lindquistii]|nr:hypothetical protein NX059_007669 [Plenodomus lindquistii]